MQPVEVFYKSGGLALHGLLLLPGGEAQAAVVVVVEAPVHAAGGRHVTLTQELVPILIVWPPVVKGRSLVAAALRAAPRVPAAPPPRGVAARPEPCA